MTPPNGQDHLILVPHKAARDSVLAGMAPAAGGPIVAPPVALFSQWLEDCLERACMLSGSAWPRTAGQLELQLLWEQAILDDQGYVHPVERAALAEQAIQADRLVWQWMPSAAERPGRQPWQEFLAWRKNVYSSLDRLEAETAQQVPWRLVEHLDSSRAISLPERLTLTGFAELTRAERAVLDACRNRGVKVDEAKLPAMSTQPDMRVYSTPDSELGAAARWAWQQGEAGQGRVGVVVNGLEGRLEVIRSVFANVFHSDHALRMESNPQSMFHISRGPSLDQAPLVRDALMLLELSVGGPRKPHEFPLISQWLLSPSWRGAAEEQKARADLELELRRRGHYRWSLARVLDLASARNAQRPLPLLMDCIHRMTLDAEEGHPANRFCSWLGHWGWASESEVDEMAMAASMRLNGALETLSRVDTSSAPLALGLLKQACASEQVPSNGGSMSPVQVLSPEEAYGQAFDAVWVMNLTADNWPARASTHPMLPFGAEGEVPRLRDDGVREHARQLTSALLASATEIVVSHAASDGDTPLERSYLLQGLPKSRACDSLDESLWRAATPESADIPSNGQHPWLQPRFDREAKGIEGIQPLHRMISVLEYQSACPLAAYLAHRLDARFEQAPGPFAGPDYAGKLTHTALECLYRPHLGRGGRPTASEIPEAVEMALSEHQAHQRLHERVLRVEQSRLETLLNAWLADEAERWPHQPVELEKRQSHTFGGFEFEVRLDRIDGDTQGEAGRFLIDYKTGSSLDVATWARERIGNPQLPLYTVLLDRQGDTPVQGVALVRVRLGDFEWKGFANSGSFLNADIKSVNRGSAAVAQEFTDWDDCVEQWGLRLEAIIGEFRAGVCNFRLYRPKALEYAGLDILLRTGPAQRWLERGSRS